MHRKGAQDAKRAKMFTKVLREVFVAAKIGPDPEHNPRLKTAMVAARGLNVPKDRIQNAIDKASSPASADNFVEMRYEGYGPGGVAIIVEALTDNKNRTAAEVRAVFTKSGGNLGETGSVNFLFKRSGLIVYPLEKATEEQMFEAAIEVGASDCVTYEDCHEVECEPDALARVRDGLEQKLQKVQN
jgi:YebC/PmpR family DNA-binding regulatory protein